MLKLALCVAYGALTRTESRGAHFRQDFPRRNDAEWLKRTLATWKSDADTLPTLAYEALDVNAMELPPGWRGYGAKDYVDHPDTPERAAEVEALKQKMAGAPRFAVQEALMPYDALLPERFRGRNERIDEPIDEPDRDRKMNDATIRIVPAANGGNGAGGGNGVRRKLTISVLRYNPQEPASAAAHADLRARGSRRHDAVHRAERDPREAGSVAAVRLRLPRRHLRQLRDGDQRPARRSPAAR